MTRAKARPAARHLPPFLPCVALAIPLMLGACSSMGDYPSLAIRDVERQANGSDGRAQGSGMPAPGDTAAAAPAFPPASADLVTRLGGLVKVATAADQQFQSHRAAAERAVAAAGSVASDSWSSASVALAQLESSRSEAMTALADLDVLYANARDAAPLDDSPSTTAIGDARAKVAAMVDAEDTVIAALSSRLKT